MCALVLSLGSCQKDYSDDIDQLKADVAANKLAITSLQQAISAGKLITSVTSNTTGYLIKFSDNTTIQVNNGTNGTPGATGPTGPTGPTGATGFTPVIGIDAQGYWTVIASNGGTATRIKDANGNYILAKIDNNNVSSANGYLTVNGVATTVAIPTIVFDSVNHVLVITIWDSGVAHSYNVGLASDFVLGNDIISLLSPIGTTKAIIRFGAVPATAAAYTALYGSALSSAAQSWSGVTYGSLLRSSGKLPVIVNPADASISGYTFEVIKQDGSNYVIQPSSVEQGYTGAFAQYVSSGTNGLYTLNFTPTATVAAANIGETNELAIRATKGSRKVFSGYQYSIKVQQDVNTDFSPNADYGNPVYIPIGTTKSLLDYYNRTNVTPVRKLAATDFFKSEAIIGSGNTDVEPYITHTGASVTTSTTTATVSNLNNKIIPYTIKTMDWLGKYSENAINITFYSALNDAINAISVGTFTLTAAASPADQVTVMLTSMFTQLDALGKTELWRNNATNLEVKLVYGTPAVNIPGVTYEFLDANGNVISDVAGTWGPMLTTPSKIQDVRKIRFTFDETAAIPGNYTGVLQFTDRRSYATGSTFTVGLPFTIVNPDVSTLLSTMAQKVPNLWNGNTLTVYGTGAAPIQGNTTQWFYNINNAYVNLGTVAAPVSPVVGVNNWGFEFVPATGLTNPLTSVLTTKTNEKFSITTANVYKNFTLDLYYYYFGNPNNKFKIERINVTSKSEVKEGVVESYVTTPPQVPAILQITNGDLTSAPLKVSDYYRAKDYLGVDLKVFGVTRDSRIADVQLTNTSANSGLVNLQAVGNDWTVQATNTVAELQVPYVDVPLTLTITDLLGQKLVGTVTVRVVKP